MEIRQTASHTYITGPLWLLAWLANSTTHVGWYTVPQSPATAN